MQQQPVIDVFLRFVFSRNLEGARGSNERNMRSAPEARKNSVNIISEYGKEALL